MYHEGIWHEYRPTYMDSWEGYKRVGDIVRCQDCAYYDDESSTPKCWRDPEHRGTAVWTRPDGFCAWVERMEVDA